MSEPENTVENTVPGKNGGTLKRGNPGNKGGGRPPEAFKAICRLLVSSPKARAAAKKILEDPTHPQFTALWKAMTERGYGKLEQTIETVQKDYRQQLDEVHARLKLVG